MDLYFLAEPCTFAGKLAFIGLKSIPVGLKSSLLMHCIVFLFFLVRLNRLFLSIFPLLFIGYEIFLGRWNYFLLIFSIIVYAVYVGQALLFIYWFCFYWNGKTKLDGVFTQEEIDSIDNYQYNRPSSTDHRYYKYAFLVGARFLLVDGRFSYSIERMADLRFTVVDSILRLFHDNVVSIVIENTKSGRRFTIRCISSDMIRLPGNAVEMKCPILHGQFIESFTSYINDNPMFEWSDIASLNLCLGCSSKKPEVVIRKTCIGESSCSSCDCPPTHCAACVGRIFAAAQPVTHLSQWMDGTASCPSCRATFCANDVLLIRE